MRKRPLSTGDRLRHCLRCLDTSVASLPLVSWMRAPPSARKHAVDRLDALMDGGVTASYFLGELTLK